MWKLLLSLLLVTVTTSSSSFDVTDNNRAIKALSNTLTYLNENYQKMNVDCLFGVVLANAILQDSISADRIINGLYQKDLLYLYGKSLAIVEKTLPLLTNNSNWHFTQHIVDLSIWSKVIHYTFDLIDHKHNFRPNKNLFVDYNFDENISDFCLASMVNQTLELKPKVCQLRSDCQRKLTGPGYIMTHKLLMLQLAKARKCIMKSYETSTRSMCSFIYAEIISMEYYKKLDERFDLFLEQSLLCGYEGYTEFLTVKWLNYILNGQLRSGCFSASLSGKQGPTGSRWKREANEWNDGCVDHTTGLGAAMLSLYVNYMIKME